MRTLPYGICCICSRPAFRPKGFVCYACQKRAQRKHHRICVSLDHHGDRSLPARSFRPNHSVCRHCQHTQDWRTRFSRPVTPATDPKSDPAYSAHRELIVGLLLGKPL